jgi:carbonic anhydrase
MGVSAELRTKLFEKGQFPYAAIVGCSDSRVPMELIFDAGPGELFVVRTAGNVVGAFDMGSLEFAVDGLKTQLIAVVGHQLCGAVKAAIDGGDFSPGLEAIIQEIRHCAPDIAGGDLDDIENKNIKYTLSKIAANPVISKAVSEGRVCLAAGKYMLDTGLVSFFD